jgi:hypothetical protein
MVFSPPVLSVSLVFSPVLRMPERQMQTTPTAQTTTHYLRLIAAEKGRANSLGYINAATGRKGRDRFLVAACPPRHLMPASGPQLPRRSATAAAAFGANADMTT